MADVVNEPENDEEAGAVEVEPKRSMRWLWIGLGAAVLVAINVGLTLALTHRSAPVQSATTPHADKASTPKSKPSGPAIFHALDPAFVVNFKDKDAIRFLQIKVQVMTHDQNVVDAIKKYSPIIRNNLLLLFSSQSYESLSSRAAKEKLQAETRNEIQKVLKAKTGKGGVDAVYFTSFVMQ
jgi:flagellar FliL protein